MTEWCVHCRVYNSQTGHTFKCVLGLMPPAFGGRTGIILTMPCNDFVGGPEWPKTGCDQRLLPSEEVKRRAKQLREARSQEEILLYEDERRTERA